MTTIDTESTAVRAITQARVLRHQADLAASIAESQAVALLLDSGLSHRAVARLTGLSKSDVARRSKTSPPLGVAVVEGADTRVYDFADEWLWGSREVAHAVTQQLLQHADNNPS